MISPVTVPPTGHPGTDSAAPPAPLAPILAVSSTTHRAAASQAAAPPEAGNPVGRANPTFQFNPAAGVLVIQFRDDSGKVALSIPSQQQINAYATDRVEGQAPNTSTVIA